RRDVVQMQVAHAIEIDQAIAGGEIDAGLPLQRIHALAEAFRSHGGRLDPGHRVHRFTPSLRKRHGWLPCKRTTTLSVAPLASITVRRTKRGPSGSKNKVRRPGASGSGWPLTSTVSGPAPPVTLSAIGSGLPAASLASSSRAPLGGNMMRSCGPS